MSGYGQFYPSAILRNVSLEFVVKPATSSWKICAKSYIRLETKAKTKSENKILFLDRDGVIIEDLGYVNSMDRVVFKPKSIKLIEEANEQNIPVVVISNQAGVARGKYSEADLLQFNLELFFELKKSSAIINLFLYCPSHPDALNSKYKKVCNCRKPGTKLFSIGEILTGNSKSSSIFIGDQSSDESAAVNFGIKFVNVAILEQSSPKILLEGYLK
jgi:D-glycero-D-manno-heptose 1,7-bisphosphate phosphatase